MSPSSNGISRLISFSAVVLPPPEGPTSTQNVPGRNRQRELLQRRAFAPGVPLRHAVEDDLRGRAHAVASVRDFIAGIDAPRIPANPIALPATKSPAVIAIAVL